MSTRYSFFKDTAPTEIYTLSLHDALPISSTATRDRAAEARARREARRRGATARPSVVSAEPRKREATAADRKSTRLNSSHSQISYAVFCLKKKTKKQGP